MALPAFIFDTSKGETPESVARQRLLAAQILGQDPRRITNLGEGIGSAFDSIGNAVQAGGINARADAAEAAGVKQANAIQQQIYGWMTGAAPAPQAAPSPASPPPAGPQSSNPQSNQSAFVQQLWPSAVEASQATGIDPRIIVAQAAVESGWGKHAPGNNYFGIKSHGQPGGNVMATTEYENGQPVRTQDSFRAYASPEESVRGYADFINQNPRYAAFKQAPDLDGQLNALGRSGYATDPNYTTTVGQIARTLQPPTTQVASADPGFVPGQPGAGPSAAPPMPAPRPAQTAQAMPPQPAPQQAPAMPASRDLTPLIQAATNPWVPPEMRAVAQSLLQQEMHARDPMRRLQMQKLQQEVDRGGPEESFYGNPVPIQNPDGTISYGQIGNRGTFKPIQLGQGQTFAPPTKTIDAGTETLIVDQAGNVISRQPKNVAGAESAKAQGKAQGEAAASLPADVANAGQTVKQIDELLANPGLSEIVGPLDQFRPTWLLGSQGNDALARYNQLRGRAFLDAYSTLRGGGAISEVEGAKAQAAIARLDRAQSEDEFKKALSDFRDVIQAGVARAQQKAGVAVPQAGGQAGNPPPASGAGTPLTNPLKSKYGLE